MIKLYLRKNDHGFYLSDKATLPGYGDSLYFAHGNLVKTGPDYFTDPLAAIRVAEFVGFSVERDYKE